MKTTWTIWTLVAVLSALYSLTGCSSNGGADGDDTDTISDSATDVDTDTGTDADTDSDTSTDTTDTATDTTQVVTPTFYGADDANIQYTGRVDFTDPTEPLFSAAGVYITARFTGTGVTVSLEEEFKWDQWSPDYISRNYYDVIIDGGYSVKISPEVGVTDYVIAAELAYGEHTVSVHKRTEASIGSCGFLGFEFQGTIIDPPTRPARKVQVIGDSIQAGSGIEAVNNSLECAQDGWGVPWQNARLGYGARAAAKLNAEYHIQAVSGIGLAQNYTDEYDARSMADVYDLLFSELEPPTAPSPLWDTTLFEPDVVIIALGTNDFSTGPDDANPRPAPLIKDYADAYIAFVDRLIVWYPDAEIFAVSSPMLGDNWPTASETRRQDLIDALALVEAHYPSGVHAVTVSKQLGKGCGTHPDVAQSEASATQVADFISQVMGWQ